MENRDFDIKEETGIHNKYITEKMEKKTYGKHGVDYTKAKDNNGFSLLEPAPSNSGSTAGMIPVRSMRLPPLPPSSTPLSAMKLPPIAPPLTNSSSNSTPPLQSSPIQPPERVPSPSAPQYERIVVKSGTITTEPPPPAGWKAPENLVETKSFTQSTTTKLTTYPVLTSTAAPLPAISEPAKKPSSSLQVNSRRKPSSYRVAFKCFFICLFLSIPIVIFIIMMALSGGFSPSNGSMSNLTNNTASTNTGSLSGGNSVPNTGSGTGTIPVQPSG
uniref:Uncharacterized protein n=1 Tax=Acrobeloides nanus TaxID=290746 RepID=A0A914BZ24_9BILA